MTEAAAAGDNKADVTEKFGTSDRPLPYVKPDDPEATGVNAIVPTALMALEMAKAEGGVVYFAGPEPGLAYALNLRRGGRVSINPIFPSSGSGSALSSQGINTANELSAYFKANKDLLNINK